MKTIKLLFCSSSALCMAMATTAIAQEAPAAEESKSTGLADIVVTARKVAENLQNVPVAVTAFSGADLEKQGAQTVADIARLTPSMSFRSAQNDPNALSVAIRGQIQIDTIATLDPSVGTYVDGLYWARAYGLNSDLLDIRSVQVLKGPQGTLFGRNTTGGAILFETNDPDPSGVSGLVSGTYGRYDEFSATGIANLPVTSNAAFRFAVRRTSRDGYMRDVNNGRRYNARDIWTGRAKFLWDTDGFNLAVSGEYFVSDLSDGGFASRQLAFVYPGSLAAAVLGTDAAKYVNLTASDRNATGPEFDPTSLLKTYTLNSTATFDTNFGAAKIIAGYRKVTNETHFDFDGTPATILTTDGDQSLHQWSVEGQLTGQLFDDRLNFATGATWFTEGGHDATFTTSLPTFVPTNTVTYGTIDNSAFGLYAQGTFEIASGLSLTGGVRYSHETKGLEINNRTVNRRTGVVACQLATATVATLCSTERSDSFSDVSYLVGLDYKVAPDVLLYAKTSKGFRSGGQNLRATTVAGFLPFDPETAYSHEAGLKSEFLDRRLRINIAGYYTLVKDIQRSTLLVFPNGSTATALGNAGKARFYGGEAEVTVAPVEGLVVSLTGSLTRPKYLEYADASGDRRYERFNNVIKKSWSISGNYSVPIGDNTLSLRADYAWTGEMPLDPYDVNPAVAPDPSFAQRFAATTQKAGGLLNARIGFAMMDDRLDLSIFGRNLTNNRAFNSALSFAAPLGITSVARREPTTYGVTATFKFGS